MNPAQLQQVAREWADDMVEDLVLGLVLETHKTAKLSQLLCAHCGTHCRQFNTPLHTDIFRHDSDAVKSNDRVRCPQCNKPYGASHLARHLEKCMQLKGARRAGVKSYAEEDSSPEKDKAAAAASENAKKRKKPVSKKSNSAANGLISDTVSLDSVGSGMSSALHGDASVQPSDLGADGTTTTKSKKPPTKRRKKNADAADGAGDAAPAKPKKSKAKSSKAAAAAALASGSASASESASASASGSTTVSTANSPAAHGEDASILPSSDLAGMDEEFVDVELEDLSDF